MSDADSQAEDQGDPLEQPQIQAAADKLKSQLDTAQGPISDEDVDTAVRAAVEEVQDAPVQTFVPLIAENTARNRLRELAKQRVDEEVH